MLDRSETTAEAPGTPQSPATVALAGLVALAVAMGVGRFALTPILPMMREDTGLSVADGGWLASANYVGYLLGALSAMAMRVRAATAIRGGLVLIGVVTLGMAIEQRFVGWIVLRALAGIANGWVVVFGFSWCLEKIAAARRPHLNGLVFAGVGTGIAVAGGFCLVLMRVNASSAQAWTGLGLISLIATAVIWRVFGHDDDPTTGEGPQPAAGGRRWDADSLRLVLCFGVTGFGYIIPATFLPVMARQLIPDPLVFGWSWPLFGVATAASTLAAAVLPRLVGNRGLWMLSQLVMALGVALPVFWRGIAGIMLAALFVGGSFMVITMVAMQEARQVAGSRATSLIAAMTSAFAAGQIAGPISVSYVVGAGGDFSKTLLVACALLVASAYALSQSPGFSKKRSDRNE